MIQVPIQRITITTATRGSEIDNLAVTGQFTTGPVDWRNTSVLVNDLILPMKPRHSPEDTVGRDHAPVIGTPDFAIMPHRPDYRDA